MEKRMITALAEQFSGHVDLGKSRCETLGMLTLGILSARTVNLANVACERGAAGVETASTYRRFQRFFQHVRLADDWAAPMIAGLVGGTQKRTLVLDRTNWKIGGRHINILVLAVATRRSQAPLMWIVLDRAGNSGAPERTQLMSRYIAAFGKDSIKMLLGDREFIGEDWLNWLMKRIPKSGNRFSDKMRDHKGTIFPSPSGCAAACRPICSVATDGKSRIC